MFEYCQSCGLDKSWVEGSIREHSLLILDLGERLTRVEEDIDAIFRHFRLDDRLERRRKGGEDA